VPPGPNGFAVYRVFSAMSRHVAHVMSDQIRADSGLRQAEYDLLHLLWQTPGGQLRAGEIADLLAWDKTRVTHQSSRMEARGLVTRVQRALRPRGTWVRITELGIERIASTHEHYLEAVQRSFLDHLRDDELQILGDVSLRLMRILSPDAVRIAEATGRPYDEGVVRDRVRELVDRADDAPAARDRTP